MALSRYNFRTLAKMLSEELSKILNAHPDDGQIVETDAILLASGVRDYQVQTAAKPLRVYISLEDVGAPVCVGENNKAYVTLLDDGFVVHVDVKTDSVKLRYLVVGEETCQ